METKHILSLSYGKDSTALLLYIIKHKLPLDHIIHCQIMFNKEISGEHPKMAEWIPQAEKRINKLLKDNGYNCQIENITAKKNFCEQFYTVKNKGGHKGDKYGFPFPISAWCNGRLKLDPIDNYIKKFKKDFAIVQYIGIASDEPKRIAKLRQRERVVS